MNELLPSHFRACVAVCYITFEETWNTATINKRFTLSELGVEGLKMINRTPEYKCKKLDLDFDLHIVTFEQRAYSE